MSEYKLSIGTKVYFCTKNDVQSLDTITENSDGSPEISHWGEGEIVAIREQDPRGYRTKHRYQVYWPRKKTILWMRNQDLVTSDEVNCPSLPCEGCGKFTRLYCSHCLEKEDVHSSICHRCGGKSSLCQKHRKEKT